MQRFAGHYGVGASGGCYGLWRCELKRADSEAFIIHSMPCFMNIFCRSRLFEGRVD